MSEIPAVAPAAAAPVVVPAKAVSPMVTVDDVVAKMKDDVKTAMSDLVSKVGTKAAYALAGAAGMFLLMHFGIL
jgi:hypothetical protein